MYCFAASVAILLITWEAVLVTGSTGARCPSACCQKIQTVSDRVTELEEAGLSAAPTAAPSTPVNKWELVFSAKSGSGLNVLDSWKAADEINANDTNANIFKSPLVEQWGKRPVDQVRIEVKVGREVKAYFTFDGRGTDKMSFMTEDRLMASSNGRLKGKTLSHIFGVDTLHKESTLSFTITGHGEEDCNAAVGWLIVSDPAKDSGACPWLARADRPLFVYCEGVGPCILIDAPIGDTFRILLKFA